jgi:hypothetical protein
MSMRSAELPCGWRWRLSSHCLTARYRDDEAIELAETIGICRTPRFPDKQTWKTTSKSSPIAVTSMALMYSLVG